MIRDITKSAISFSWALSLLGLKQAMSLLRPGQAGGDLFAPMAQAAVNQMDESMKGFHRSGDVMQSRMVDMAFSMMNPANWLDPGTWNIMRAMGNFVPNMGGCGGQTAGRQRSSPAAPPPTTPPSGSAGGPTSAPVSNQTAAAGWGPMP